VFKNSLRVAYGAGLVLRLGIARLELNYTVPVLAQKGDRYVYRLLSLTCCI